MTLLIVTWGSRLTVGGFLKNVLSCQKINYAKCQLFSSCLRLKRLRNKQNFLTRHTTTPANPAKSKSYYKTIDDCPEMPENTKSAIKEAVRIARQRAKCKREGKYAVRYEADWLLQSLLLKMTSPRAYRYLRDNNILPLPHPPPLQGLIRDLPCSFGFSETVLILSKQELQHTDIKSRHGAILFDEMKVIEAVDFTKHDMGFKGYVDYEDFTHESNQLADHALVLMFRPFISRWVQSIASFASKGAASGDILAKLITAAVLKLESCGALVDCTISDGASTNRNFWSRMGVTGAVGKDVNNKADQFTN